MQFQAQLIWAAGLSRPSEYIWQPKVSTFSSASAGTASIAATSVRATKNAINFFMILFSSRVVSHGPRAL